MEPTQDNTGGVVWSGCAVSCMTVVSPKPSRRTGERRRGHRGNGQERDQRAEGGPVDAASLAACIGEVVPVEPWRTAAQRRLHDPPARSVCRCRCLTLHREAAQSAQPLAIGSLPVPSEPPQHPRLRRTTQSNQYSVLPASNSAFLHGNGAMLE